MSKSLSDPVFAGRVATVDRDLTYAVRYGDAQTRWFEVSVFEYPELQQADAKLKYPQYTQMPEAVVPVRVGGAPPAAGRVRCRRPAATPRPR